MKFKSKLSDIFLLIGTIVAIVISIILWIFVMTNDQHFNRFNQSTTSSNYIHQQSRNDKSLYDLYLPTSSYGFRNGQINQLYDSKKNLPFEFSKELKKMKVKRIVTLHSNQRRYERMLNNESYIQLSYPDEITFNLFTSVTSKKDNRQFSRVFVTESNKTIYLGNDKTNQIYRLNITGANFDLLRKYARNAHQKIPVKFVRLKSGYTPFYDNNEKWRVYSYLINRQSDSYFVSRLLGTSGVSSKTSKHETTYSLNYYTHLRVPKSGEENDHNYFYTHYEKETIPSTTSRLLDSIFYVHRLGLMEQDLRFFDADNNSVLYMNYIEGSPVFLNDSDPQIKVNFTNEAITMNFNSTNFQIPIPFDGSTETLESTEHLLSKLVAHGISQEDINKIVVGFRVEKDKSNNNLVNLVPTYYVKAYGEWKSAKGWLNEDMTLYQKNNAKEGN